MAKDKQKASELLLHTEVVLKLADQYDVTALRKWLLSDPARPLICVANGGQFSTFPVLLYEMNAGVAKCITPLEFASMSPKTIANSKVLLMSSSGRNKDITFAAQRAVKLNPHNTVCFTFKDNENNKILKELGGKNCFIFPNDLSDGFVAIRSKFFTYGLFYKAFTGKSALSSKLNLTPKYDYFINSQGELPELKNIKHFVLLYSSYGQPVAHDVESMIIEGSVAPIQVCDYRNYCHGRFIYTANRCQSKRYPQTDTCAILLTTPREAKLAENLRKFAMPANLPIVQIHTELESPLATIELLYNAYNFIFDLAENHLGINPNSPPNFSGIDKRHPMNNISFATELKKSGELTF